MARNKALKKGLNPEEASASLIPVSITFIGRTVVPIVTICRLKNLTFENFV